MVNGLALELALESDVLDDPTVGWALTCGWDV